LRFDPTSVDDAKAGKIEPDGKAPEPVDGIVMGRRILSNLDEEFEMLIRILRRMASQERAVSILGRPPDRVEFVISHHCFCCAGRHTSNVQFAGPPALLRPRSIKSPTKIICFFWVLENTFDFDVVERA
jgi:hypothetical protein